METNILTKEMLIETINDMESNEIAFLSNIIQGQVSGATKKKFKSFSVGFTSDCFKNPETVGDLMNSKLFGLIIMDKKLMNQDTLKKFNDYWKKSKDKSERRKVRKR